MDDEIPLSGTGRRWGLEGMHEDSAAAGVRRWFYRRMTVIGRHRR